jgi:sugar-specific transcriptional regulator TrmB
MQGRTTFEDETNTGSVPSIIDPRFAEMEKSIVSELLKLDIDSNEAKILVCLMVYGKSTVAAIAQYSGIYRTETYKCLSGLAAKGVVFSTLERPQKFYSLSYREVVDSLVAARQSLLRGVIEKKDEYHNMIESITSRMVIPAGEDKESYQVVTGADAINAKLGRMLADAKEEVLLSLSMKALACLYHGGVLDMIMESSRSAGIPVRIQAACANLREYIDSPGPSVSAETIKDAMPASFVIFDDSEIVVLHENSGKSTEMSGFYTNNRAMVSSFKLLFAKSSGKQDASRELKDAVMHSYARP